MRSAFPLAGKTHNPITFFEFTCQPLHAGELTTLGQELLGCLPWDEESPFVAEDYDREVFMRFDGLVIRNCDDGRVSIGFLWQSKIICFLHVEGPRLERDSDVLYLRGIEGRQRVSLS